MDEHHYLIRGGIQGRERMRVVGRVMRPATLALLGRAGVGAGMRCLDVGCGAGEVTFDLASLVGLTGHVVGVDLDPTKIDLGRGDAEQAGLTNVELKVADIDEGLGEEEYDVVYARFLLTHLRDPRAGVAAMVGALKPGGRLVVEDIDYRGSFSHPPSELFERYEEIYELSAQATGGDPFIGARLPELVSQAGCVRVEPTISQPAGLEGDVKLLPALTLENIRATAVRHGVADADEVDRVVDTLYEFARDATTYVANPRIVQVWGEKP